MEEQTHVVKIEVIGRYPHGDRRHVALSIAGDGGLDHMIEAFQAALVAAGFAMDTAAKLGASVE